VRENRQSGFCHPSERKKNKDLVFTKVREQTVFGVRDGFIFTHVRAQADFGERDGLLGA